MIRPEQIGYRGEESAMAHEPEIVGFFFFFPIERFMSAKSSSVYKHVSFIEIPL